MNAQIGGYAEYKDSGAAWLGKIPAHWELERLGSLLKERGETNSDDQITDVLSVVRGIGVIPYEEKGNIGNKKSEDTTRYKIVRPDDIVVNSMNVIIGSVGLSAYTGCLSPVYYVLTKRNDSDYAQYLNAYFQTKPFQESLVRIGNGILAHRMRIPMEKLKSEPFPHPPPDEQAAIVKYLAHVDRKIDRFIRSKRRMIELLNEQKQAIIHQAVTRGLDPSVPMKDSGVEWLGEIPAHWEVRRVKNLVSKIDQGISPQAEAGLAACGSWGVLKSGCVNRGIFRDTEHKRLPQGFPVDDAIVVHVGDVLVSRASGSPALVGSIGRVGDCRFNLILSDKTFRLKLKEKRLSDFIVLVGGTRYFREQVEQSISGAEGLANNLPLTALKRFRVAIPPVHEVESILDFVASEVSELEVAIERFSKEIELVREYRTRLISDVVTGKIDVRAVAATLAGLDDAPDPTGWTDELDPGELGTDADFADDDV